MGGILIRYGTVFIPESEYVIHDSSIHVRIISLCILYRYVPVPYYTYSTVPYRYWYEPTVRTVAVVYRFGAAGIKPTCL